MLLQIPEKPIAVVLSAEEIRRIDCLSTLIGCLDESSILRFETLRLGGIAEAKVAGQKS